MATKTLSEAFPDCLIGGGILSELQEWGVPWAEDSTILATALDCEYYGNRSGDKPISPLVTKLMTNGVLSQASINLLCMTIMSMCAVNWTKQYATLSAEYNPIQNYDMTEVMDDDEKVTEYGRRDTRTDNLSHQKRGTDASSSSEQSTRTDNTTSRVLGGDTITHNTTDTTTPNLTGTTDTGIYGFNSATSSPSDTSTQHTTGNSTLTRTGTDSTSTDVSTTNTGTVGNNASSSGQIQYDTTETDTGTVGNVSSGTDTETRNYTLTRSGNIGVTTSQQMLEAEHNLWAWNFFRDVVFPDLDSILTLRIY